MKPIYIEMSAFGSYQHEVIDFENVNHGLFLITGDTGAGKTTIFDAITYALFDKTSGGKREGEMMRSQYASPELKTQVKFKFLYNDKQYTITRSPRQEKWKKVKTDEGERFEKNKTPMLPEVELIMPDGTVYPGKKTETDEKIKEIIGLGVEQFTQIAMLAQGEFMKLLHASSKERKDIFAKIFDTAIYEMIEKQIYFKFKEITGSLAENKKDIIKELERVNVLEDSIYREEWLGDKYREKFSESDKDNFLKLVKNICEECETRQAEVKEKKKEAENKLDEVKKSTDEAIRVNKLFDDLADWTEKQKKAEERAGEISELKAVVEAGSKALIVDKYYNDYSVKQRELNESEKRIEQLSTGIKENKHKLEELRKMSENFNEQYEKQAPKYHTDILKIEESINQYEIQDKLIKNQNNLKEQISKSEEELLSLEQKKDECGKTRDILYDNFVKNQADILREGLEEGKPCPVCGSIHHNISEVINHEKTENIAVNSDEIIGADKITEDEIATSNIAYKTADGEAIKNINKKFEDLSKALDEKKDKLNSYRIEISKNNTELENLRKHLVFADKSEAVEKLNSLKNEFKKLEKTKTDSTKNYKNAKEEADKREGEYSQEKENRVRLEQAFSEAGEKYFEVLKSQGFADEDKFKASLLNSEELRKYQQAIKDYETNAEITKHNIMRLNQETEGRTIADVSKAEELRKILESEKEHLEKAGNKIFNIVTVNREAYKKACDFYVKREKIKEREVLLHNLNDTASGKIPGKHINFQTYIQRRYFKQIINSANKRLYKMSGNQFILQCRDMEKLGSQGEVGLDLDVYSLVNEQTRDVKTLSGGESFMAALSMALGMSDIIQNSTGNIHIDTMFIDEGFGSLSDETRSQAIETLNELSEGKRLVGIISHVSELKAQVETKLEVSKTDKGSSAKWN